MRNARTLPAHILLLSQTAEHALRAILFLARNRDRGFISANEIAASLGAPANYMGKTLRRLAEKGILRSVRGPRGGWQLLVDPVSLSAAQVVRAFEDPRDELPCLMGSQRCDPERPCRLHARWTDLASRVVRPLEETSIADLLADVAEPTITHTEAEDASRTYR